jgi:hypothetical protein
LFSGCSEFEVPKVDQDPQCMEDLLILDPHHQKEAPTGVVGGLKWYSWRPSGPNCCSWGLLDLLLLWATTSVFGAKTSVHGMKFWKKHFAY